MTPAPRPQEITAPLAHADIVVLDYLAALWAESEDLTPELRDELMTTVADYIAMRRTAVADPIADPAQIVGRLGPPEALVASVRRGRMPMHLRLPAAAPPRRVPAPHPESTGTAASTAVALLLAGTFVLPIVSPLAAMVMVSASRRWSGAQKAAAWLLTGGATLCGFLLMLVAAAFTNGSGFAIVLGYLTMVAGAFIAGVTLLPGLIARRPG
jgi:hypothetical protein